MVVRKAAREDSKQRAKIFRQVPRADLVVRLGGRFLFQPQGVGKVRFSHLVPRSSEVNTRAAAAMVPMRCGQTVTRSRALEGPSSALARSAGARSAVISSL